MSDIAGNLYPRALAGLQSLAQRAANPYVTATPIRTEHQNPGFPDRDFSFEIAAGTEPSDPDAELDHRIANITVEATLHECGSGRLWGTMPAPMHAVLRVWSRNDHTWTEFRWHAGMITMANVDEQNTAAEALEVALNAVSDDIADIDSLRAQVNAARLALGECRGYRLRAIEALIQTIIDRAVLVSFLNHLLDPFRLG